MGPAEVDTGRDLHTLTGGLYMGAPDSRMVAGSLLAAQEWDLPHELLDAAEIRRRFPTLSLPDGEMGLYEEVAGFARPEATVAAHLSLAERRGAELHFDEPVTGWETTAGGGVRVTTASGTYTAGRLARGGGIVADLVIELATRHPIDLFDPRRPALAT